MDSIDNGMDTIDSRDVIARIEELQEQKDNDLEAYDMWMEEREEFEESHEGEGFSEPEPEPYTTDTEEEELKELKALAEEAEGASEDWTYGATLVRDSYFVKYIEELCADIGDIPQNLPWYIADHIDWEGVAEELKQDYTEVDFAGTAYFIR